MFTVLYVIFRMLEHAIRGLVHGETFVRAVAIADKGVVLARALTVFFAFIPLFALFEIRRVMGEDEFLSLFIGRKPHSGSAKNPHIDARRPTAIRV
jgi:hypothetical protein